MEVIGEFSGADRTDKLKKPGTLVETVDIYYVVDSLGSCSHGDKLKIDKGHMVAQQHIRGLQTLHTDLFYFVFFACEQNFGKYPDEPNEEHRNKRESEEQYAEEDVEETFDVARVAI